jgi:hypothetical protein
MSQQADQTSASPTAAGGAYVLTLKIAVTVMGIMIVAGVALVIARIAYLVSASQTQSPVSIEQARGAPGVRLAVPPGALVRQISLSGDRLAVHYEGPGNAGIAVINLATGGVLSRIEVVPEAPK